MEDIQKGHIDDKNETRIISHIFELLYSSTINE